MTGPPPAEYCGYLAPKIHSTAIMAAFQITGAAYERKNFLWLFRTPRHQAESTSSPAPGKRMRTRRIVNSRFSPEKPPAIDCHQKRRCQHPDQRQNRDRQRQQRRHASGRAARLFVFAARPQARVHGNERGGEHPFPKQVLQCVGNAERGFERVRCGGISEIVREDAVPNQSGDAAQKNPRSHQERRARRSRAAGLCCRRRFHALKETGDVTLSGHPLHGLPRRMSTALPDRRIY